MKAFGQYDTLPKGGVIASREGNSLLIAFDFQKVEQPEDSQQKNPDNLYSLESIIFNGPTDYGRIISAIVSDRYSNDDVQALIANYTEAVSNDEPSDKDKEYIEEYQTFQTYRKHAKEIAKAVIEMEGI